MHIALAPRRSAAIAVFISLGLTCEASAQAPLRAITPYSVSIYNFAKVNDDYYRGGQPLDGHYADLAALGVKTVINLIGGDDVRDEEKTMVEQHGMTYLHIPMSTRKAPTDEQIATFMSAVDAEGAVYVHCVGGRHRTGVMTAIYRMTNDGLTGEQAFKEMKQYKYGPDFLHPEFKKFVYKYEPQATAAAVATSSSQQ
jgi:protein tyrosine phosphatase (PTP) superfamily phosphohydrolase (DUF442 family)